MSAIFARGLGVVSPAGWSLTDFREALRRGEGIPAQPATRAGWPHALQIRTVPAPTSKPNFMAHPRLRRSSAIAQYAVSATLEALGDEAAKVAARSLRLGVIYCAMAGCVGYSRRFYDEILQDPATASPLIFPETVFNAPASHLAALLGTTAINYTLIGDPGTFLQGLALGARWLSDGRVDGCLVVAAEELDWLVAEAFHLFDRNMIVSAGAGALYLSNLPGNAPAAELSLVTEPCLFGDRPARLQAAQRARAEVPPPNGSKCLLCDGLQGVPALDRDEIVAWKDWPADHLSVKAVCGEGLMAAAAWQCIAAVDAIMQGSYNAATVNVVGTNQQAIAAQFIRGTPAPPAQGPAAIPQSRHA